MVADNPEQAREQWVEAAGRNRADLGLEHARYAALNEARNYRQTPIKTVEQSDAPAAVDAVPEERHDAAGRPSRSAGYPVQGGPTRTGGALLTGCVTSRTK